MYLKPDACRRHIGAFRGFRYQTTRETLAKKRDFREQKRFLIKEKPTWEADYPGKFVSNGSRRAPDSYGEFRVSMRNVREKSWCSVSIRLPRLLPSNNYRCDHCYQLTRISSKCLFHDKFAIHLNFETFKSKSPHIFQMDLLIKILQITNLSDRMIAALTFPPFVYK